MRCNSLGFVNVRFAIGKGASECCALSIMDTRFDPGTEQPGKKKIGQIYFDVHETDLIAKIKSFQEF